MSLLDKTKSNTDDRNSQRLFFSEDFILGTWLLAIALSPWVSLVLFFVFTDQ